jgi:UDP-galactopyranose mutase
MSSGFDYVVIGAGMFGSVFARCAAEAGRRSLVIDRRSHIAGNCYSEQVDGVEVHRYGPHIFHTNDPDVWSFVNRFAKFNNYRHRGLVRHRDRLYSFPINLATLHQVWGVSTPLEAKRKLDEVREPDDRDTLESWTVGQIGRELYELFIRGYTTKQWGRDPSELPSSIIKRIPIRLTWDDHYFDDRFQGIPVDGYTRMFENMLDHPNIEVETGVDFFANRRELEATARRVVYSGKIDEFFDYRFGELDYRSLRFRTTRLSGDFQGAAIVNYAERNVPYTRVVEHKHFAMRESERTVVTFEYPQPYEAGREPFYPVRDWRSTQTYQRYRKLADEGSAIIGGRLGSYQYFDMHQVVGQAMVAVERDLRAPRQVASAA